MNNQVLDFNLLEKYPLRIGLYLQLHQIALMRSRKSKQLKFSQKSQDFEHQQLRSQSLKFQHKFYFL